MYGNLESIATLSFRGAKTMAAKLEQNKEVAYLSYKLATIKTDVELDLTCAELTVSEPDVDTLQQLFKQYEFKRWLADVEAGVWLENKKGAGAKAAGAAKPAVAAEAPKALAEASCLRTVMSPSWTKRPLPTGWRG